MVARAISTLCSADRTPNRLGVGENGNTTLSAGNTGNAGKSLWCLQ
jgi:hypothetical protein